MSLKINKTFRNLIPPLSSDELQGLEESILSQGRCRETIKLWRNTIIDGHNRYAICQQHNIPYRTQKLRFSSKKDAELWIIQNQLGRRNLTSAARIKLVLHKESLLRENAKKNRKGCDTSVHVRPIVAKEAGVSEQTVQRYMRIRSLGTPELLKQVEAGHVKIGTAYRMLEHGTGTTPPANTPALAVTTRTVETFFDINNPPDLTNPCCEAIVLGRLEKLAKLYSLVSHNAAAMQLGPHAPRAYKLLEQQMSKLSARC